MGYKTGAFSRMRCKFCKSKDVEVFLRAYGLALCRQDFLKFFTKRVQAAIDKFKLFRPDESVIVAVSGGKDSLALLYALNEMGYKVKGYFLDLGIDGMSNIARQKIESFSDRFAIPVYIERLKDVLGFDLIEVGNVMRRPPCSFCGTLKRYYMNNYAKGAVLATGHTLYDEAATLLANNIQWKTSYLSRQYPLLPEENGFARKVKPLVFVSERETAIFCFFKNIDYVEMSCPLSKGATSRIWKRHLLSMEKDMPGTIIRYLKGFYSMKKKIDFPSVDEASVFPCERCGYPTTADRLCSVCRIKDKLNR